MESLLVNRPADGKGFWWRLIVYSLATGFSALGVVHLLISAFLNREQETLWEPRLPVLMFAAFLVPAFGVLITLAISSLGRGKRAAQLFGTASTRKEQEPGQRKREIRIVVSSYRHTRPYDGEVKERYYKPDADAPEGKRFVRGSREAVVGLITVRSAVFAWEQAQKLVGFTVTLDGDSDAAASSDVQGKTLICLGSPGTNDVARAVYKAQGLNQSHLYHFDDRGNLVCANAATLTADHDWDYATLTKLSRDGAIYFVCAGVDEEGTIAAVSYLLQEWQSLANRVGDKDFHLTFKVEKKKVPKTDAVEVIDKIYVKTAKELYFNPLTT